MAATPSVKITKSQTWRGTARLWTNRYHFTGGVPATTAAWNTFFDAIVLAEKAIHIASITIVQADGYPAGSDIPLATKTYTTAGTKSITGVQQERQVCALVRYVTTAKTSRNHPVYLFNYYHGTQMSSTTIDDVDASAQSAYTAYAGSWISGFSDGTTTHTRAGPNGATAVSGACETFLTHRDFPRR